MTPQNILPMVEANAQGALDYSPNFKFIGEEIFGIT